MYMVRWSMGLHFCLTLKALKQAAVLIIHADYTIDTNALHVLHVHFVL